MVKNQPSPLKTLKNVVQIPVKTPKKHFNNWEGQVPTDGNECCLNLRMGDEGLNKHVDKKIMIQ